MTTKNTNSRKRPILDTRALIPLVVAIFLVACGGSGGGGEPPPPPEPVSRSFTVSLEAVVVIDRSDGSFVQVDGGGVSGATATLQ